MLRTPKWWHADAPMARRLEPLGRLYGWFTARRLQRGKRLKLPVPVICVGNVVAGGSGKTPVVMEIARILKQLGETPHIISRGYGGNLEKPILVNPAHHMASEVGDEPLLLAAVAPTWSRGSREDAAQAAIAAGASVLVLDDGLQDASLHYDATLLVVDGEYGFGNGRLIPAGPLREPVMAALKRANACVVVGKPKDGLLSELYGRVKFQTYLVPEPVAEPARKYIAFAGIGRPEKFFASCRQLDLNLIKTYEFPDHYAYPATTLGNLEVEAEKLHAQLITTAKDMARLPAAYRNMITVLEVRLVVHESDLLQAFLEKVVHAPAETASHS